MWAAQGEHTALWTSRIPFRVLEEGRTPREVELIYNHESVAWLERFLDEYPSTVIAVTHDRYFLDNVAQWILELDRGRGIPFEGNYTAWLEARQKRMAVEQRQQKARERTLARELEWVRMGSKARQAKGKARLGAYEQLLAEANDEKTTTRELEIAIPPGPRLGDKVIEIAVGQASRSGLTSSSPRMRNFSPPTLISVPA